TLYDVSSGLIPTGEAFYILANSGTSITFNETEKGQGTQGLGRFANPSLHSVQSVTTTPFFQIDVVNAADTLMSEVAISFNPNATLGKDNNDGIARPWNNRLQITTASLGTYYAINGLPGFSQNYALPVRILSKTTTQYTISAKNLQKIPVGPCLILHDNYGIMPDQDLRGGAFTVTINDSETVARFVLNITTSPLSINTNAVSASCSSKNDAVLTAVGNDAGPWTYVWKNASGVVIKTSLNVATADSLKGLNSGNYSVDVTTVGSCNSATQTFNLVAPASASAAFTAPSQVNMAANVSFVNNSANATNYIWDFGDGGISSLQTPTYVYNNPGTYNVVLEAINANCNDTATTEQVIIVNSTSGIKQANIGSGDINISRDITGNYLQFDYATQTKVNVIVYNVLGQAVLTNTGLNVVNDKVYLNVADYKNQVLYVNITNLITNTQTTKKFVND
ncbi:MAG TPA: PKD domain-containing protein, partial [Bacteroidia bacterium]|nr:PKD domain-containing protein [Bacteroidia bacterium]